MFEGKLINLVFNKQINKIGWKFALLTDACGLLFILILYILLYNTTWRYPLHASRANPSPTRPAVLSSSTTAPHHLNHRIEKGPLVVKTLTMQLKIPKALLFDKENCSTLQNTC